MGYSLQDMARQLPIGASFFAEPVDDNGVEITWESGDTLFTRRAEYVPEPINEPGSYGDSDGKGVIKLTDHAIWGEGGSDDPVYGDYSESRTVRYLEPDEQPNFRDFNKGPRINHNPDYVAALLKNILDIKGILKGLVGRH